MKHLNLIFAAVVIAALTVAAGVMHGRMNDRWGAQADTRAAAAELEALPETFGPWEMRTESELESNVQRLLACYGSVNRVYENVETGEQVAMVVLIGPSQTLTVHSPEICYSGAGYSPEATAQARIDAGTEKGEFRKLTLRSQDVTNQRLRVYYGWSEGGAWTAPESPRWSLGHAPYLYKLQAAAVVSDVAGHEEDVVARFLQQALPVLRQSLPAAAKEAS